MTNGGLEAVYFPRSHIRDRGSLATYILFFDRLHLVHLSDDARNPTEYLKGLPDKISLQRVAGDGPNDVLDEMAEHYKFVLEVRPLLGEVLFYHPHVIAAAVNRAMDGMLNGGIDPAEFVDILSGNTPALRDFRAFADRHPEIAGELAVRVVPTAMTMARHHGWNLVGDDPAMEVPRFSRRDMTVAQLTSVLAPECIRLAIPACTPSRPELLLEVREELKDLLLPFRMSVQRMSSTLRAGLDADVNFADVQAEARFFAESQVEPAIHELRERIARDRAGLVQKVFGKVVSMMPLVAKVFAAPTPESIYQAMSKAYGDVGELVGSYESSVSKEPGLAYLIGVTEAIGS